MNFLFLNHTKNIHYNQSNVTLKRKCLYAFLLLISCQILFWTMIPALLLKNTYVDILENLNWGRHFQWGYDKHPFLEGFITYWGFQLLGEKIESIYFVSQLAIATCFYAVWQLAKRMLPPVQALIAVSLLVTIHYFSHSSPELNADVLQLPFWALTCLYFYDALTTQKIYVWLQAGFFAGIALMAKYFTVMLLLPMLLFILINKKARKSFSYPGIYLAVLIFIIIIAPNMHWLAKHGFVSVKYAYYRTAITTNRSTLGLLAHFKYPLSFILSVFGIILPTIGICMLSFRKQRPVELQLFDKQFLLVICFGPIILTILFSLFTAAKIHFMWATPLFNLFGIFLMVWFNPLITRKSLTRYFSLIVVCFLAWLLIYSWQAVIIPYTTHRGGHESLPGKQMSLMLTKKWHDLYHIPLAYVVGERELALNIAQYSPDHPEPSFNWDDVSSPWVNKKDLVRHGAILIYPVQTDNKIDLSELSKQHIKDAQYKTIESYPWAVNEWITKWLHLQPIPPMKVFVGFIPPRAS